MSSFRKVVLPVALFFIALSALPLLAQTRSEQVQISPPLLRSIEPPSKDASATDLESRADELHVEKLYFDAIDYYRAALTKSPNNARVLNKICRTQLVMTHWRDAQKTCQQAIRANKSLPDPYSNLGVALYEERKYGGAVREYRKAIALDGTAAAFYNNLGAALFAKKEFDQAVQAYQKAMELDPDVFDRTSRGGVQAQVPSPEDRARYDYTVARLYAKMGFSDRSLEYLRKAREEGYKDFNNVYKDVDFAELRKDKRFTEMMATKVPALPE